MLKRAMIAACLLCACTPQKPPETPAATPETAQQPAPDAVAQAPEEIPAVSGEVTVTAPLSGARVTSPLTVEGAVINNFMFEGVFPVELVAGGKTLAEAPGQQQAPDNWTNPGPVKFKATVTFTVTEETPAELILREDMPKPKSPDSDEPGPARTLRIPVVLLPAK